MTQPQLIKRTLVDLHLDQPNFKAKAIPMASSRILHCHSKSDELNNSFNYRLIIGKLNSRKSDTARFGYATHQCERYSTNPHIENGAAVRWLGRYLIGTSNKGMLLHPDTRKGLEVHVNSDFIGSWDPNNVHNAETAKSRHGYVIS